MEQDDAGDITPRSRNYSKSLRERQYVPLKSSRDLPNNLQKIDWHDKIEIKETFINTKNELI